MTIHDGYGQTETNIVVANGAEAGFKPGSLGRALPGHHVAVIDGEGNELPVGIEGDLAIRGRPPTLFAGYWESPDDTKSAFRGDWYLTGDVAMADEEGLLWFVGRAEDVITSRGRTFGPFEVERVLREHDAIAASAVIGLRDLQRGGHFVRAYVVPGRGGEGSEQLEAELRQFVGQALPEQQVPREIVFVEELPTVGGRVSRHTLRERPVGGRPLWELPPTSEPEAVHPPAAKEPASPPRVAAETAPMVESEPASPPPAVAEAAPVAEPEPAAPPAPEPVEPPLTAPEPVAEAVPLRAPEPEPVAAPEPIVTPEPVVAPEPVAEAAPALELPEPAPAAEPEPELHEPEPTEEAVRASEAVAATEADTAAEPERLAEAAPAHEPEHKPEFRVVPDPEPLPDFVEPSEPEYARPARPAPPPEPVVAAVPEPLPDFIIAPQEATDPHAPPPALELEPEPDLGPLPDYVVDPSRPPEPMPRVPERPAPPAAPKPFVEAAGTPDAEASTGLYFPPVTSFPAPRDEADDDAERKRDAPKTPRRRPAAGPAKPKRGKSGGAEPGDESEEVSWMEGLSNRLSAYSLAEEDASPGVEPPEDEPEDAKPGA